MNRCTPGHPHVDRTSVRRHTAFTSGVLSFALPAWVALSLVGTTAMAQTGSLSNASASALARMNTPLQRTFPPKAMRAQMTVVNAHEVTLNGTTVRLSPGSIIRTTTNGLVVSGGLIGQTFVVNYTTDTLGQAHEIWILTTHEAAEKRAGSDGMTTTNVVSEER